HWRKSFARSVNRPTSPACHPCSEKSLRSCAARSRNSSRRASFLLSSSLTCIMLQRPPDLASSNQLLTRTFRDARLSYLLFFLPLASFLRMSKQYPCHCNFDLGESLRSA